MRAFLVALALLITVATMPMPAVALSNCGGTWSGTATCSFYCDDINLYVRGSAVDLNGFPASVTVTAECGIIDTSGQFVPAYSLTCTSTAPVTTTCFNTMPNWAFPMNLTGVCTVTGNTLGGYDCMSAP